MINPMRSTIFESEDTRHSLASLWGSGVLWGDHKTGFSTKA